MSPCAGDCSAGACDVIKCENEAICAVVDADRAACMCPLGTAGNSCQSSELCLSLAFEVLASAALQINKLPN